MKRRRQIERDDVIPFFIGEILDRGNMLDAGIVDENIDPSQMTRDFRDHAVDFPGIHQIGAVVKNFGVVLGLQAGLQGIDLRMNAQAVEGNSTSGLRERLGDILPQSTG